MRAAAAILLAVLLAGCLGPAAGGVAGVAATPLAREAGAPTLAFGRLDYLGGLTLDRGNSAFGGLSGLSLAADGAAATTISDRGNWFRFRLLYDDAGRLSGIADLASGPLLDPVGKRLRGHRRDAESVRALPGGGVVVSFERIHRLWLYPDGLDCAAVELRLPEDSAALPFNQGLEAMTPLGDGRFLLIAEGGVLGAGIAPAWLGGHDGWRRVDYRLEGRYVPTDAVAAPNGDVIVLERRASLIGGFSARLVRLPAAMLDGPEFLVGEELGRLDSPLPLDNFEGVAVHRRGDGRLIVSVISDDNFSGLQATLLLQFLLRE